MIATAQILIIDDEERLRNLTARILTLEGYSVSTAGSVRDGLHRLERERFDLVLCDVKLPDGNGVELTADIKKQYPDTEIILLTAYGNIPDGVQAIKNGAFDYLTKGDDQERILPLVSRAIEKVRLLQRVRQLEKQVGHQYTFADVTGNSIALMQAVGLAQKVAPTDTPVLLSGETGTGKEIFAQAIHQAGPRNHKAFVALNCSAISHDILESELFGHRAGAFTGAMKNKPGLFEEAHGGTLFLDEIGEMPSSLQAKFLRVLESGEFIPVGDTRPRRADVRLISATNRDLSEEIEQGRFRADLYYRLAVFQIQLPSLRERRGDIALLVRHFLRYFAAKLNKPVRDYSPPCLQHLEAHSWKGNIRELRNIIERAVILCSGARLEVTDLPLELQIGNPQEAEPGMPLSAFSLAAAERVHIQKVLLHTGGNKTEAARLLGIGLTTLYRKIEQYRIV